MSLNPITIIDTASGRWSNLSKKGDFDYLCLILKGYNKEHLLEGLLFGKVSTIVELPNQIIKSEVA